MIDLANHPYFKEYIDEKTGVKSYFLKEKVSQMHQHFYFCNTSLTFDSKYLWVRCLNAPAQIQSLAVVSLDTKEPFIRQFQGAGFSNLGNLPSIIPGTHDVIFAEGSSVYKVDIDGNIEELLTLSNDITRGRSVYKLFTHATLSCDKKLLAMDIMIADKTYMAFGNLETKEIDIVAKMGGNYNHAQFSPVDPDLIIVDQDGWSDYFSGERFPFNNRIWLMDTKGKRFEPLIPTSWFGHDGTKLCHDFWALDGSLCYIDYDKGAYECNVSTREHIHVWKRPICHAHTNFNRSLWVGDQTPYEWSERPCRVLFYDRETNKEIDIFSAMPAPKVKSNGYYHLDPHPAFTDDGEYIISTVTLLDGSADVAITPVEPLLELCRKNGTNVN